MFSAIRDRQIIEAGGFWCSACCEGKPASEQSLDPRYCQSCYDFLLQEAKLVSRWKTPEWVPIVPSNPSPETVQSMTGRDNVESRVVVATTKMSTKKRGCYKKQELPEDYIRYLANDGMGSKMIASRLKVEHGIIVSYKTIQRVLSGKRKVSMP